jgi:activator of HSP90 ATPase
MPKTVQQTTVLPASPDRLFDMYLDPKQHAAITGGEVVIAPQPGAEFKAFNGVLSGRILAVTPKRMIVQTWRSSHWRADDLDSILILTFDHDGAGGRIELVHVNVPDHDYDGVNVGWEKFYWMPWHRYLEAR